MTEIPPEIAARLLAVDDLVAKVDESVRPAAFDLLSAFVLTGVVAGVEKGESECGGKPAPDPSERIGHDDLRTGGREFLAQHHGETPADSVKAIAAYLYSIFGSSEFAVAEVQSIADGAGVTVPARVDVTLNGATVKSKKLFRKVRSGVYQPTVHGEAYFKEQFLVRKGTRVRVAE